MALMWPMGHGDSRAGGNPLPRKNPVSKPVPDLIRGTGQALDSRPRFHEGRLFAGVTDRQFEPNCAYREAQPRGFDKPGR